MRVKDAAELFCFWRFFSPVTKSGSGSLTIAFFVIATQEAIYKKTQWERPKKSHKKTLIFSK